MKNISKLILTNFQQWKEGEICFKPGLNIIIGDTESGKSTLFRAINSILTGKMPEDYIRKGTKGCEVEIHFSDNTIFKRLRTKKENMAIANEMTFDRVGKEIPFEYFNKLGKTSIEFGSKELSLCSYSQFEPHFFITLSDYDKSKLIGTICGIDIVDKLMDLINKDIRANNTNIKFLEQQIKEQQAEKEVKVPEFKAVDEKMTAMTKFYDEIKTKFDLVENLVSIKQQLSDLNNQLNTTNREKTNIDSKIDNFDVSRVELLSIMQNYRYNLQIFNAVEKRIKDDINKLKIDSIDSQKSLLLENLSSLKYKLSSYNKSIGELNYYKKQTDDALFVLTNQKKDLLKDYDKCPLCGGVING